MTVLNKQARESVVPSLYEASATDTSGPMFSMTSPRPRCFGVFGHRLDLSDWNPHHALNEATPTILLNHPNPEQARFAIVIVDLVSHDNQRLNLTGESKRVYEGLLEHAMRLGPCWVIGSDLVDEVHHPKDSALWGRQWLAQPDSSRMGLESGEYPLAPPHIGTGLDLVVMSPSRLSDPDWLENCLDTTHRIWRELWSDECGLKTLEVGE